MIITPLTLSITSSWKSVLIPSFSLISPLRPLCSTWATKNQASSKKKREKTSLRKVRRSSPSLQGSPPSQLNGSTSSSWSKVDSNLSQQWICDLREDCPSQSMPSQAPGTPTTNIFNTLMTMLMLIVPLDHPLHNDDIGTCTASYMSALEVKSGWNLPWPLCTNHPHSRPKYWTEKLKMKRHLFGNSFKYSWACSEPGSTSRKPVMFAFWVQILQFKTRFRFCVAIYFWPKLLFMYRAS